MTRIRMITAATIVIAAFGVTWLILQRLTPPSDGNIVFRPSDTFNFGAAEEGAVIRHDFLLQNNSRRDVHILAVEPGCGCTSAQMSSPVIPAGASAKLNVRYDAEAKKGGLGRVSIIVRTDDPATPVIGCAIEGTVRSSVYCQPASISYYVARDAPPVSRSFSFRGEKPSEIQIIESTATSPDLTMKLEPSDSELLCKVTFTGSAAAANRTEQLKIKTRVGSREKEFLIPVYIRVK